MSFLTTNAVVFRKYRLGESDLIVSLLTREAGLIKAVAKGAAKSRKRFGGLLLTGTHVTARVFMKKKTTLHRLEAVEMIEPYTALSKDPVLLGAGSHLLELTAAFALEQVADPRQFALLTSTLRALNTRGLEERLLRIFELRTLAYNGVAPNFDVCVTCGEAIKPTQTVSFSVGSGGVICRTCEQDPDAITLRPGTRRLLAEVLSVESKKLPGLQFEPEDLKIAKRIVPPFCEYTLGRKLRSLRMIKQLLAR